MLHESGEVVAVTEGRVTVRGTSRAGCARCAAGRGCGGAYFSRLLGEPQRCITGRASGALAPGDPVRIAIPETTVLRAAVLAYLVPLAALLAGAVAGQFFGGEAGAVGGSAAMLLPALIYARWRAARLRRALQPRVYRQ